MTAARLLQEGAQMGEYVVTGAAAVPVGELAAFDVDGARVAIANVGGTFHAFGDTCTHLHCSLAEGKLDGTVVTCACHGSQFDVTTGEVLRGPAQTPVRSYSARVENDALRIES
jgi:nitrite reductase/ring-hydroxylating ferredoxin subunit